MNIVTRSVNFPQVCYTGTRRRRGRLSRIQQQGCAVAFRNVHVDTNAMTLCDKAATAHYADEFGAFGHLLQTISPGYAKRFSTDRGNLSPRQNCRYDGCPARRSAAAIPLARGPARMTCQTRLFSKLWRATKV